MLRALRLAGRAARAGEVPVGALVVDAEGRVLSEAHNETESLHDPTAHAEILALRRAGAALGNYRLNDCVLVVTLEPCAMCAGAVLNSRISRVFYGASDPREGAVCGMLRLFDLPYGSRPDYEGGVLAEECAELLSAFFSRQRMR